METIASGGYCVIFFGTRILPAGWRKASVFGIILASAVIFLKLTNILTNFPFHYLYFCKKCVLLKPACIHYKTYFLSFPATQNASCNSKKLLFFWKLWYRKNDIKSCKSCKSVQELVVQIVHQNFFVFFVGFVLLGCLSNNFKKNYNLYKNIIFVVNRKR